MDGTHTNSKRSVLFVYMGLNRRELLPDVEAGNLPDSAFRGYLSMRHEQGQRTDFFDMNDLPSWVPHIARRMVSPNVLHLLHIPRVLKYDYVITSDSLLLAWITSNIGRLMGKAKWIYIPINSSVLTRRHARHPVRFWALIRMWSSFFRIAYITRSQADDFLRIGIKEKRLTFVPFGIDTRFFSSEQDPRESEYVLSIGRDLGRDYQTLFDAASKLPYRFIIATAPKNIPQGVEIPSNVEIRYNVDADGIRALYRGAACVVILLKGDTATEGSDCTGQTVMLEALSARQAVVATNRSWIQEYFEESQDYMGVPPGDADAAAKAIQTLWENQDLRVSIAKKGQEAVRERYDSENLARNLLAIIAHDARY